MTTAEKLNLTVKELPEPMLREVLDFAEFLKQKNKPSALSGKGKSETDNYFANSRVIEAIERGKKDIKAGRVTTISDTDSV
ncbi:MAG: DUF2281 domain-containing protein [Chlorobium sp.]